MKYSFPSIAAALLAKHCLAARQNAGEIPVVTILDPIAGWSPLTYASLAGGSSDRLVVVDTGSSTISFCNDTDMGDAKPVEGVYGCNTYGDGSASGWVGQLYNASLSLGTGQDTVRDPTQVQVFKMDTENHNLCSPYIDGILGVDLSFDRIFGERQSFPPTCNGTIIDNLPSQFGSSMLTSDDLYTFGFHGLSPTRNGGLGEVSSYAPTPAPAPTNPATDTDSVIAFGETSRQRVQDQESLGTASFTSEGYDPDSNNPGDATWYTFVDDVTWTFRNLGNGTSDCEDVLGWDIDCSYTVNKNDTDAQKVIIDSGAQVLSIPTESWPDVQGDTELVITIGDNVELTIDAETLRNRYSDNSSSSPLGLEGKDGEQLTLGFPLFWRYDIVFDVVLQEIEEGVNRYGNVTFYKRSADEENLDLDPMPIDDSIDEENLGLNESKAESLDHDPLPIDDSAAVSKNTGLFSFAVAAAFVAAIFA